MDAAEFNAMPLGICGLQVFSSTIDEIKHVFFNVNRAACAKEWQEIVRVKRFI